MIYLLVIFMLKIMKNSVCGAYGCKVNFGGIK